MRGYLRRIAVTYIKLIQILGGSLTSSCNSFHTTTKSRHRSHLSTSILLSLFLPLSLSRCRFNLILPMNWSNGFSDVVPKQLILNNYLLKCEFEYTFELSGYQSRIYGFNYYTVKNSFLCTFSFKCVGVEFRFWQQAPMPRNSMHERRSYWRNFD